MSSTATRRGLAGLLVAVLAIYAGWLVDGRLPYFALDLFRLASLPPPAPAGQRPSTAIPLENAQVLIVEALRDEDTTRMIDEATLARVIRKAVELGAVSVGVDAVFAPRPESSGLDELRAALRDTRKVVLAANYESAGPGQTGPRELLACCGLADLARGRGLVHVRKEASDDRLYRMNHVYNQPGLTTKYSLPLELAAWHLSVNGVRAVTEVGSDAVLIKTPSGTYPVPFDSGGYSLVPYLGPAGTIPSIPWKRLFEPQPPALYGKTVILGSGRIDIDDSYPTPFHRDLRSRMSGTEILAQTLSGMIHADRDPYPVNAGPLAQAAVRALTVLLGFLAGACLTPPLALGVIALLFALVWVNAYEVYAMSSVILSPLGATVGLTIAGLGTVLAGTMSLFSERRKLEGLMETYFEEELVPGQSATQTGTALVERLLAAKDLIAPPGMVIDGPLGAGGMSVVLAAHEKKGGREIALKLLSPQLFRDDESRNRFRREADTAGAVLHPNVVGVVSSGVRLGILFMPYIAYERVRGPTLRALLADEKKFNPGRAAAICMQVLAGLSAAHEKGIVHRDVKPENIIITTDGVVKVLDFGIARIEAQDDGFKTRAGIVLGTPAYMAPEVVRGQPASPSADIYAVGILLYELITGQPPFSSDNVSATLVAHVEKRATPPSQLGFDIPRALESALMSMLEKTPDRRPASAEAAIEQLAAFASSIVGPQLPIREVVGPSTSATRAVKPSLAQSGTLAVPTGAGNRLSSARLVTPPRSERPTLGEEAPPPQAAPTSRYAESPAAPPTADNATRNTPMTHNTPVNDRRIPPRTKT